jgi:hypothetical protein
MRQEMNRREEKREKIGQKRKEHTHAPDEKWAGEKR